jgi:hypothetical protein
MRHPAHAYRLQGQKSREAEDMDDMDGRAGCVGCLRGEGKGALRGFGSSKPAMKVSDTHRSPFHGKNTCWKHRDAFVSFEKSRRGKFLAVEAEK